MARQQDHYARRAAQEGFPARSVYKLEEIDKRFGILTRGGIVLDIGAAPGSWSMYARKRVGKNGKIVAVDLQKTDLPADAYTVFTGDAFLPDIRSKIVELGPYTTVLSDAAPSTTGNRTVDTARSFRIVEQVIALSKEILAPGGSLVAKVFQGGDERELLEILRSSFTTAKIFKPKSSRKESFEVFLVATGFHPENSKA
jgi:23S rRNA (uridine2552-2'-O)-methyltransferase